MPIVATRLRARGPPRATGITCGSIPKEKRVPNFRARWHTLASIPAGAAHQQPRCPKGYRRGPSPPHRVHDSLRCKLDEIYIELSREAKMGKKDADAPPVQEIACATVSPMTLSLSLTSTHIRRPSSARQPFGLCWQCSNAAYVHFVERQWSMATAMESPCERRRWDRVASSPISSPRQAADTTDSATSCSPTQNVTTTWVCAPRANFGRVRVVLWKECAG